MGVFYNRVRPLCRAMRLAARRARFLGVWARRVISSESERGVVEFVRQRLPKAFPVFVCQGVSFTGSQQDGEVDLVFASDELERSYLVVECKFINVFSGATARTSRRKARKKVGEQAFRGARQVCALYRRPVAVGVFTSENPDAVRMIGLVSPVGELGSRRACPTHPEVAVWPGRPLCTNAAPCRQNPGCSWATPCQLSVSVHCRKGCSSVGARALWSAVGDGNRDIREQECDGRLELSTAAVCKL